MSATRRMRACFVESSGKGQDDGTRRGHVPEHGLAQNLIAPAPVEILHEAVLHGLARRDVMPRDPALSGKGQDRGAGRFGAPRHCLSDQWRSNSSIADNPARLAPPFDQAGRFARHTAPADRHVRNGREAFPGDGICDVEDAKAPPARVLVGKKISRPPGVWPCLARDRCPGSCRLAPCPAFAPHASFFPIRPADTGDPRWRACGATARTAADSRTGGVHWPDPASRWRRFVSGNPMGWSRIILRSAPARRQARRADRPKPGLKVRSSLALHRAPYRVFASTSFMARDRYPRTNGGQSSPPSSICPARSFFSLACSSSSAFSRLAARNPHPARRRFPSARSALPYPRACSKDPRSSRPPHAQSEGR